MKPIIAKATSEAWGMGDSFRRDMGLELKNAGIIYGIGCGGCPLCFEALYPDMRLKDCLRRSYMGFDEFRSCYESSAFDN